MSTYEIVAAIILFATLLVLGVTMVLLRRQLSVMQNESKARMRPYLGFTEITRVDTEETDGLEFKVFVKNFGLLPAKDAKLFGEFILDGAKTASCEALTRGSVFPSDESWWLIGVIPDSDKDFEKADVISGAKSLRLGLKVRYYGSAGEEYSTSTYRTYEPRTNDWFNEEGTWA